MNSQSGWESITRFSAIKNVSIFHVIKQIIRKILIVYFAIVRYILWGDKCGGNFRYTESGIKDCTECMLPHKRENYGYIIGKYGEIMEKARKNRRKEIK